MLLLLASCSAMVRSRSDDPPISFKHKTPVTETFVFEGLAVQVWREHRLDEMGPDEEGLYEFRYEYDLFEFSLGSTKIFGRTYTSDPEEAHLLGIEDAGEQRFLAPSDFGSDLVRAAVQYFRCSGKTNLTWLDPSNALDGYSPVP